MRTFHRLRLLDLLLATICVELSTSILFALSKPGHPHQKHTVWNFIVSIVISLTSRQYVFGGDGRNRTAVQNTFLVASNNHIMVLPGLPDKCHSLAS